MIIYDYSTGLFTSVTIPVITPGQIVGTSTNDNAAAGNVGEYVSSYISSPVNFPVSGNYGDLTSISLTAGDWDISEVLEINGAVTGTQFVIGIGTASGNSSAGLNEGDNVAQTPTGSTGASNDTLSVPAWRVPISSTTVYYFKYFALYTVGTPQARGRISARRIR